MIKMPMPEIIEYTCGKCGNIFEAHSHTGPRINTRCPECNGKAYVSKRHKYGS